MKKLMMVMMAAVVALTVGVTSAEAKRMGGGSSFGKQSQSARQAPAQSSQATNAAKPAPPAAAPASPWRGILGGALLGLGLGALLSHLGIGGALASMISTILMVALLGLAAMFIYRMIRARTAQTGPRPAWAGASSTPGLPEIGSRVEQAPLQRSALQGAGTDAAQPASWGVPDDFDTTGFLRHAKTYFIRLQAAWDRAEVDDIREFTTPEMFAEIRLQIQERGASASHTDVVTLDAVLLGIETIGDEHLASVRFSGMIKEDEQPSAPFSEIWNLAKPVKGNGGWLLAGIQQVS